MGKDKFYGKQTMWCERLTKENDQLRLEVKSLQGKLQFFAYESMIATHSNQVKQPVPAEVLRDHSRISATDGVHEDRAPLPPDPQSFYFHEQLNEYRKMCREIYNDKRGSSNHNEDAAKTRENFIDIINERDSLKTALKILIDEPNSSLMQDQRESSWQKAKILTEDQGESSWADMA